MSSKSRVLIQYTMRLGSDKIFEVCAFDSCPLKIESKLGCSQHFAHSELCPGIFSSFGQGQEASHA